MYTCDIIYLTRITFFLYLIELIIVTHDVIEYETPDPYFWNIFISITTPQFIKQIWRQGIKKTYL